MSTRLFERDMVFQASPERVWRALTEPAEMEKWMGRKVSVMEPRPGGALKVEGLFGGIISVYDPLARLVWEWDPDDGSDPNTEEMTLHPENGGTRLHLKVTARGKWAADLMYFGGMAAGWDGWLADLAGWVQEGVAAPPDGVSGLLNAVLAAEEREGAHRITFAQVRAGGAAAMAGVQDGDVLVALNSRGIDRVSTFWGILWKTVPGETLRVDLQRGGRPLRAEVVLAAPKQP